MNKTLYSLMLNEDVVRAADAEAHRQGMSRSALIEGILAEHLGVATPQSRINEIFTAIEEFMSPADELIPFFSPHSDTISLKSSLEYKYRPTVKYEVELGMTDSENLGVFSVIFRTQSVNLIKNLTEFFRLWAGIENRRLAPLIGRPIECELYEGKFLRPIALTKIYNCNSAELAEAISEYVSFFDSHLKNYLSGGESAAEIENAYIERLGKAEILI